MTVAEMIKRWIVKVVRYGSPTIDEEIVFGTDPDDVVAKVWRQAAQLNIQKVLGVREQK